MIAQEIRKGIYWVGAIDWDVRNFHGYKTQAGTTYNAYLIIDEKITLIDTVKVVLVDQMFERISEIIEPGKIDYVLSNHVEMDHSGSIFKVMERVPDATVVTSPQGKKGLERHFKKGWDYKLVKTSEIFDIGKHNLTFVQTPMVHWPDSMVTYMPDEKILFSNDAFGQHIASSERFDHEIGWDLVHYQAKKYYANIVLPFGAQVQKALSALKELEIELICPSHGIIWKDHIEQIVHEYCRWSVHEANDKAVIIYDSMWKSTEKMAYELAYGLKKSGIETTVRNLKVNHISDVMTDVLDCRLVLLGTPTLNNGMMPSVGQFLTYLKGLSPQNRIGFVFGSYGWGGQAVGEVVKVFQELKWDLPVEGHRIQYVPDQEELSVLRDTGCLLAEKLQQK